MKNRNVLLLVLIMIFSIFLSGCSLSEKITSLKQGFSKEDKISEIQIQTPSTVVIETPDTSKTVITSGEMKIISLYFTDDEGEKLVVEEREIRKVEGIARATIEELIKGPAKETLRPTIPATTKLLDINVRPEGLAIVDLSGDLIKDLPTSSVSEKLAVYAIVNTLTQFPTVERVELRIDGRNVDTLLGYVKITQAMGRNTSIIK